MQMDGRIHVRTELVDQRMEVHSRRQEQQMIDTVDGQWREEFIAEECLDVASSRGRPDHVIRIDRQSLPHRRQSTLTAV